MPGKAAVSTTLYAALEDVLANINGEDFEIDKFGVKISFAKDVSVPHDREGEYFWICISGDFPYVLDEGREIFK